MKRILFLLVIFVLNSFAIKLSSRTLGPEHVQLQIEYLGNCQEFNSLDSSSVYISSSNDSCLPITLAGGLDTNNLQTDYFCSDISAHRSIIHFVEIFETNETTLSTEFVFSFIPSRPFRAHAPSGSIAFARRPNCEIQTTTCNSTYTFVSHCQKVDVVKQKKYVVSHDRIYIGVNTYFSSICKDTALSCCAYVDPKSTTGVGICPNTAPTDLLAFPKKRPYNSYNKPNHYEHHSSTNYGH